MNEPNANNLNEPTRGVPIGREDARRMQKKKGVPLGVLLLERKLLTVKQLEECVREQNASTPDGKRRTLGQIIVNKGYVTEENLKDVLGIQGKTLGQCRSCGARWNITHYQKGVPIVCEKCKGPVVQVNDLEAATLHGDLTGEAGTQTIIRKELGIDTRKIGRYQILRKLGTGAVGTVFLARDEKLSRTVALKLLNEDAEEHVDRFEREARSIAALKHPNIVGLFDIHKFEGRHYLSMEYVPGRTMADLLTENLLPFGRALEMLSKVARGVDHAHQHAIIHRDLKPANILVQPTGDPVITDFGLAKTLDASIEVTHHDSIMGTPSYMSPEQITGGSQVDGRTDVFSLGVILYRILTGELPFQGETAMQVITKVLRKAPKRPRDLKPQINRDLEAICLKSIEKEREYRYSTAGEFGEDLDRFLRGEAIRARPIGPLTRMLRWTRRHPVIAASILVGGLALGGGTWFAADKILKSQREARLVREKQENDSRDRRTRVNKLLKKARDAMYADRYPEAVPLILEARGLDPDAPELDTLDTRLRERFQYVMNEARGKHESRPAEALDHLAEARVLDPKSDEAKTLEKKIHAAQAERFGRHMKNGMTALDADPNTAKDHFNSALQIRPTSNEAVLALKAADDRASLFQDFRKQLGDLEDRLQQGRVSDVRTGATRLGVLAEKENAGFVAKEVKSLLARCERLDTLRGSFDRLLRSGDVDGTRNALRGLREIAFRDEGLDDLDLKFRSLDAITTLLKSLNDGFLSGDPPATLFDRKPLADRIRSEIEKTTRHGSFIEYAHVIRDLSMNGRSARLKVRVSLTFSLKIEGLPPKKSPMEYDIAMEVIRTDQGWKITRYEQSRP